MITVVILFAGLFSGVMAAGCTIALGYDWDVTFYASCGTGIMVLVEGYVAATLRKT
mgnify:CR=1 FL=1